MAEKQVQVHKLVLETARSMANSLFEVVMLNNEWYDGWKKARPGQSERALRAAFVAKHTVRLLPSARATLASMLTSTPDAALKEEIYEALCLDATLKQGRQPKPLFRN